MTGRGRAGGCIYTLSAGQRAEVGVAGGMGQYCEVDFWQFLVHDFRHADTHPALALIYVGFVGKMLQLKILND